MTGNILILEDDVALAVQWRAALKSAGFTVFISHGAKEALNIFSTQKIDLCIVDFMVRVNGKPSSDGGLMFLGNLDTKYRKKTKILGVSGMTQGRRALNAEYHFLNLGTDGFLGKPFANYELIQEVKSMLSYDYAKN